MASDLLGSGAVNDAFSLGVVEEGGKAPELLHGFSIARLLVTAAVRMK